MGCKTFGDFSKCFHIHYLIDFICKQREIHPEHQPGKYSASIWSCQVPVTKPLPRTLPTTAGHPPEVSCPFRHHGVLARTEPSRPGSAPAAAKSQVVKHSSLPRLPGTWMGVPQSSARVSPNIWAGWGGRSIAISFLSDSSFFPLGSGLCLHH